MNNKRLLKINIPAVTAFVVAAVFNILVCETAYCAENTSVITPYTSTYGGTKYIQKQGDTAAEARKALNGAAGTPWRVGKYTRHQLNTMNAEFVLKLLTGNYGVYDNRGTYLGTAKEMFNGVWGDLNPAKVLGIEGGTGGGTYKMNTGDISKFDPNTKKETKEKLYIPANAVYVRLENIRRTKEKYTLLSSLTIPQWNQVAQFSEVFDKDYKRVEFTRINGKTY